MSSATARTEQSGGAVTTDSVITSRISTDASLTGRVEFAAVATLSPRQLAARRRIEAVIGLVAPALDLLLATGERVSRIAGPEDLETLAVPPGNGRRQSRTAALPAPEATSD
jgi:hypothetical protein